MPVTRTNTVGVAAHAPPAPSRATHRWLESGSSVLSTIAPVRSTRRSAVVSATQTCPEPGSTTASSSVLPPSATLATTWPASE